jgi:hypothetical protein
MFDPIVVDTTTLCQSFPNVSKEPLPREYFTRHRVSGDWTEFLNDCHVHWPTDADYTCVDFIRDDIRGRGNAKARTGSSTSRRRTEERVRGKSVFHCDVQGQVAKSTHAGLPWLRFIRRELGSVSTFGRSMVGRFRRADQ